MSKKSNNKLSFEDSLKRLEEISDLLESDSIGLDESIKLYEEGTKLAQECFGILDKAELKVVELKSKLEKTLRNGEEPEE